MRKPRDWSVYAVFVKGAAKPSNYRVRALDGVLAPGRRAEMQPWDGKGRWKPVRIVEPWDHGYGSILCVEWI